MWTYSTSRDRFNSVLIVQSAILCRDKVCMQVDHVIDLTCISYDTPPDWALLVERYIQTERYAFSQTPDLKTKVRHR